MSSSRPPLSIAIIGAGIGGITLSIALSLHTSFKITIYESRPSFSEIGAGVGFGPNAFRAMRLISPSISDAYDKVKTANRWPEKDHVWFDIRSGLTDEGDLITESASEKGFTHCGASRAQFLDELVKLIPESVEIKFGKKVVDVQQVDEGTMKIIFQDGEEAVGNAVVGCDGIRSVCRTIMLGTDDAASRAVYSGKYAYRKVVPMEKAVSVVGKEMENRQIFVGHGGHILMFPIRNGAAVNFVIFRDSNGLLWTDKNWVIPSSRDELLRDYEGWGRKASQILGLIDNPEKWALFNHQPASTYAKGNFCILGDAAHASTPHCGAGAGFAIEDAHLLAGLLTPDLVSSAKDVQYAFQAYDQYRRPRSQELVERSREQGRLLDLQKPDGSCVSHEELRESVQDNMKWVWEVDLVDMLNNSRARFREFQRYP
ncbi:mannitol 1-phosphate dehydrogenase [Phlyctema vagabunda]|uniref:Mannitol 1-phosphate dehydrogenase n=1 Tax=Phlyctema vagabunda TaxID=108571 RepID=A0ABR4P535_9HELO